jgi:UDP-glucose:(heptosyl)LPS alpha-1,3-glucosyltransferase
VKIALVHPKFGRSGGAERYALGLAGALAQRGHEVHLFGRSAEGVVEAATFHRVPSIPFGRALKTYSFDRLTRRAVRPGCFDIVQGFGKTTCQTVHRTGGGVHRAYMEREGRDRATPYDRVVLRIEDALFSSRRLRAVICPSSWVGREVARYYPSASPMVSIIPNGVDVDLFRPEGREGDRQRLVGEVGAGADAPLLLFVATNFPLKGLGLAVEALARLPTCHLAVVGGDAPGPFRELASRLGVSERLHFLGERRDMGRYYRGADVLVHPTRYDPFANVCLEAAACGTPVVTTAANGASDLLRHGRGGVVVGEDGQELAAAVGTALGWGEAGREAARTLALGNDWKGHVEAVEGVYRRATEKVD